MKIVQIAMMILLPVVAAVLTDRMKDGRRKSVLTGLIFGLVAVYGTEFGVDMGGAVLNTRDASVICAGAVGGWQAALTAGFIGAVERYFSSVWNGIGVYTRLACTIATACAGIFTAFLITQIFGTHRLKWHSAGFVAVFMEVFHMFLVIVTHPHDLTTAVSIVRSCTLPLILVNTAVVILAVGCISRIRSRSAEGSLKADGHMCMRSPKRLSDYDPQKISNRFNLHLSLAMLVSVAFVTWFMIVQQKELNAELTGAEGQMSAASEMTVWTMSFLLITVFGVVFVLIYRLVKRQVIDSVQQINADLGRITQGDLDVVMDVRCNREFEELSDGVNKTVDKLKTLINEANARIDEELEFAKQVQLGSLPAVKSDIEGLQLGAYLRAAKEVGGDFYDFFRVGDRFFFLIADVSGKGISGAMFMMRAKALIGSLAETTQDLTELFTQVNEKLCEDNPSGMFVTSWMGCLDTKSGMLDYVNAGHNPPVLLRAGGEAQLLSNTPHPVLGAFEGIQYRKYELQMNSGDLLLLYTDGVTEAQAPDGHMFGMQRLLAAVGELNMIPAGETEDAVVEDHKTAPVEGPETALAGKTEDAPADALTAALAQRLDDFAAGADQFDDITLLTVRYTGRNGMGRI